MSLIRDALKGTRMRARRQTSRAHPAATPFVVLAMLVGGSAVALADNLDKVVLFHIQAQTLQSALVEFGIQAHLQVSVPVDSAMRRLQTAEITGNYTGREALSKLLSGTGLRFVAHKQIIEILPRNLPDPTSGAPNATTRDEKGVQADKGTDPASTVTQPRTRTRSQGPQLSPLQEVVVTGTLIPGVKNLASPLTVFTQDDISDSGASTLQDFMQAQSFDFGGGASVNTIGSINGGASADNASAGTGFNLRGLGNDATLVLLDGHRIAAGNVDANFVDTSLIPLNAIDRIEVEPAGASATYGADAVGGVVNLITKRYFSGLETQVRYGDVAQSGSRELQIGQIGGQSWSSGSAVLAYEFYDFTPLNAQDRGYLYPDDMGPTQFTLMNEQVRQSAFASIQQSAGDDINIYATGLYAHRETDAFEVYGTQQAPLFANIIGPDHTSLAQGILGSDITLTPNDAIDLSVAYSDSRTQYDASFGLSPSFMNLSPSAAYNASYSILSLDGTLTGSLLELPNGPLRFAIGGEDRREAYDLTALSAPEFQPSRNILSAFAEFNIPLLDGPSASRSGALLSADMAVRIDRYSEFGTTTNPNVGITWRPLSLLKLRTTFGTSYVAPDLAELNSIPEVTWTQQAADPVTGGLSNILVSEGGNPNLKPETADVVTLGADFGEDSREGFRGSVTYYHIDFQRLITTISDAGFDVGNALELESELGPSIVQRNPALAEVAYLTNQPTYEDLVPGGATLSSIAAIVNDNYLNLSRFQTDGLDLHTIYTHGLRYGALAVGVDGTYILNFQRQVTAETPVLALLDTPYNPVDFKARAKVAFTNDEWLLAAFLNYVNSYQDNRVPPTVPVASWTTVDLNLRYSIPDAAEFFKGTSISLSVINAANRRPPYVAAPAGDGVPEADFDGANANVLGRVISLEVNLRY